MDQRIIAIQPIAKEGMVPCSLTPNSIQVMAKKRITIRKGDKPDLIAFLKSYFKGFLLLSLALPISNNKKNNPNKPKIQGNLVG